MTPDQVKQLEQVLEERFFPFIPERTDPATKGWKPEDHRKDRLSRSLAALAISRNANVSEAIAADAVIDGFDDNGIDAVFFDRPSCRLILVQSKFKEGAEPDLGETGKFTDGVRDLLARRYDRFNEAFNLKLPDVASALDEPELKVAVVLTHLGGDLARHAQSRIDDLLNSENKFKERAFYVEDKGDSIYEALAAENRQPEINSTLEVHYWYMNVTQPRVLYGQITAKQLAKLHADHGRNIFAKNIRGFIGSSDVNEAITATLRDEPELLMHLNNGITIVCRRFDPRASTPHERGVFDVTGLSVVNGAQTVGSIAQFGVEQLENSPAKVHVTFVESENTPTGFESRVTQARNFQNRVRPSDFASQDPQQERLRRELAISGITYQYKSGEEPAAPGNFKITLEDAALALSCFSTRLEDVVIARKSVGQLTDRNTEMYARLFTAGLTAARMYRTTITFRFLNEICDANELAASGQAERLFYRHLRFFVMNMLRRRYASILKRPELALSNDDKTTLSRVFNELATLILDEAERLLKEKSEPAGYLSLSRNQTDLTELSRRVMTVVNARDTRDRAARAVTIDQDPGLSS